MRSLEIVVLLGAPVLLFGACSTFQWSGHPVTSGSSSSALRTGSAGHDDRGHGLPLHTAPDEPSFIVPSSSAPVLGRKP